MMIRFVKPLRIFFISLLAILALFAASSVVISVFYEKALVRFLRTYLDEHLLTEIAMDDIRFRVFKGFPNATVEISNVVVFSGKDFTPGDFAAAYADTLLQADEVTFQFNLLQLIRKNYELRKIEMSHGFINVLFDKKDRHNLRIWKGSEKDTGGYAINLRSIVFSQMQLRVAALPARVYLSASSKKTSFKGSYRDAILSGEIKSDIAHTTLLIRDKNLTRDADLLLQLNMLYANGRFRVREGKVTLNKAAMLVKGEYKSGKQSEMDLTVDIPKFGLAEALALLPVSHRELTNRYRFDGNGRLHATIRGPVSSPEQLQVSGLFSLSDCSAHNLNTNAALTRIHLTGAVSGTRKENFNLRIADFSSELGNGNLRGNFTLCSLKDLNFTTAFNSTIDLNELNKFIEIDTLENIKGIIQSQVEAAGKLSSISGDSLVLLLETISSGNFRFNEVGIRLKNPAFAVEHINGRARIGDHITLDSLFVSFNGNNLLLDGMVRNLPAYLLHKGSLRADLDVFADAFSINQYLLAPAQNKKSRSASRPPTLFPSGILLNAHVKANEFTGGKFNATDLDFNFTLKGDSIYIHHYTMKFPDGHIRGNALVTGDSRRMLSVTCNAEPENINIRQLFTAFNNFSQQFILDKNVRGLLGGKVSFFIQWDSSFHFIAQSVKARAEIEIRNGELVQFEPMMKLSRYINLEELKLIRFSNLKNEIYIQDKLVTIPEMAIHSSAFNISVSGTHTFDNVFDYRMKVLLSEVLFNKARKKKEVNEFMVEESREDQTTIPLMVAGTPEAFDVKFDRRRAFDLTRKTMQQPASSASKENAGNFRIEWEEDKPVPEDNLPDENSESSSDFKVEWDDE
jgi:hypothetical protein